MSIPFKAILVLLLFSGCRVVVERPANPEILILPASPGPGFIYINDSWRWNNRARTYSTSPGYWAKPKRSNLWVDGHWRKTRGGWKYVKGHWG